MENKDVYCGLKLSFGGQYINHQKLNYSLHIYCTLYSTEYNLLSEYNFLSVCLYIEWLHDYCDYSKWFFITAECSQWYLLLLPRGLLLTSVICLEWRELELVWRRQCVLARAATQTLTPGPGSRSITKLYFNESWGCWEPETILLFRRQANTRPSIDLFSNQLFYLSLFVQSKQILFEGRKPIKASF